MQDGPALGWVAASHLCSFIGSGVQGGDRGCRERISILLGVASWGREGTTRGAGEVWGRKPPDPSTPPSRQVKIKNQKDNDVTDKKKNKLKQG